MADSFDNPELSAMVAIVALLQELPDHASRLRVMRWSFGRFSGEFKRPVAAAPIVAAPSGESLDPLTQAVLTVAPEMGEARASTSADFAHQISELHELFPKKRETRASLSEWLETAEA